MFAAPTTRRPSVESGGPAKESTEGGGHAPQGEGIPLRVQVVLMLAFCSFIGYLARTNITVTSVTMKEEFGWTEGEKGFIMSGFYYGYMLSQIPAGWLAAHFGGKAVLGTACLGWSLASLAFPHATSSFGLMFFCRLVTGLLQGVLLPTTISLLSTWIPVPERSRAISICSSGGYVGIAFSSMLFPSLINIYNWSMVFYWCGAVGIFWCILWNAIASNAPPQAKATTLPGPGPTNPFSSIPWRNAMRSKALMGIVFSHFSRNWLIYVMVSWLPTYIHDELGVNMKDLGYLATMPWVFMFLSANAFGWYTDNLVRQDYNITKVRKLMQGISQLGPALFLILIFASHNTAWVICCICIALLLTGAGPSGFEANLVDITGPHAGVFFGISNTIATIPGVLGVGLSGLIIASYDDPWPLVIMIPVVLNVASAAFYITHAHSERLT